MCSVASLFVPRHQNVSVDQWKHSLDQVLEHASEHQPKDGVTPSQSLSQHNQLLQGQRHCEKQLVTIYDVYGDNKLRVRPHHGSIHNRHLLYSDWTNPSSLLLEVEVDTVSNTVQYHEYHVSENHRVMTKPVHCREGPY